MTTPITTIVFMDPDRVDGVENPANGTEFLLMKSASPQADLAFVKSIPESRFTLGLAYPSDRPDVARARDGRRDTVPAAVLEQGAWSWMTKSRQIGLFHGPDGGQGQVVESAIHRAPDWVMKGVNGSEVTIRTGDWLLGVIWDEDAWSLVKSGMVRGFSPQGRARRAEPNGPPGRQLGQPDWDALRMPAVTR